MIPGLPWDAQWHAIAQWMNVLPEKMAEVLPNKDSFELYAAAPTRVSQRALRDHGCVTAPKRGCPSHQGHDAAGALGGLRELTDRSRLLSYRYLGRLTSYARATMVLRLCYLLALVHKKETRTRLNREMTIWPTPTFTGLASPI